MTGRLAIVAGLALLAATACTNSNRAHEPVAAGTSTSIVTPSPPPTAAATAAAPSIGPLGARGCRPASPVRTAANSLPEVQGTATAGQLWGLLFHTGAFRVGDEVKIVWRMTGRGDLHLTATAAAGVRKPLAWGPEPHSGSNYHRPGDEWGAGYRFTQSGCWNLHAARDDTAADVWLWVT